MPGNLLAPGHTACAGCGQALAARLVVNAAGPNIIVTNATGCLEVFTSLSPMSSWEVPWIHSLFENSAAVASGVEAALRAIGKSDKVRVLAFGGDGGTADIGLQALSGMIERGHDVLYVCYDNEAYMNTGVQRSGLTPMFARTTTSPSGKIWWGNLRPKKDMPAIVASHGALYVATASVAYPRDLMNKVKKALTFKGPKYIQVHVPCPLGWAHEPALTPLVAKLAVETGLYPLFEMEGGKMTRVRKVKEPKPVTEYLKLQKRFRHLFKPGGEKEIEILQEIANENLRRYGISDVSVKVGEGIENLKEFTLEELARYDGSDGRPAYIAYKGVIYNVSKSTLWESGVHEGVHFAGQDLTEAMSEAPHLEDVLEGFPVVGKLKPEDGKEILGKAIELEYEGIGVYKTLLERVEDKEFKEVLSQITKAELSHLRFLEGKLRREGGGETRRKSFTYGGEVEAVLSLVRSELEALRYAMEIERKNVAFYQNSLKKVGGGLANFLKEILDQERAHLESLQKLENKIFKKGDV